MKITTAPPWRLRRGVRAMLAPLVAASVLGALWESVRLFAALDAEESAKTAGAQVLRCIDAQRARRLRCEGDAGAGDHEASQRCTRCKLAADTLADALESEVFKSAAPALREAVVVLRDAWGDGSPMPASALRVVEASLPATIVVPAGWRTAESDP